MSKFRDQLKETAKNIILSENLLAPVSKYRLAVCSAINDDGTCLATVDGNEVTVFPLYPIVLGQNIMLIFGDIAGKVSAVPLRPAVPAPDLIHPPFFTGGGKTRTAVIHQVGGSLPLPPTANHDVDFQDLGSSNVYRLSFPDLNPSTWILVPSGGTLPVGFLSAPYPGVSLSADGSYACVAFFNQVSGGYKLRLYNIGTKLSTDPNVDPISADDNLFVLTATLVNEYTTISSNLAFLAASVSTDVYFNENNNPVATFIADNKTLYWLEQYDMVFSSTGAPGRPGATAPLNLFLSPPGFISFQSLCTLYYVKRLNPGGSATTISIILGRYEPGPSSGVFALPFSPTDVLDISDDESIIRVFGLVTVSGASNVSAAVMDKITNPVWVSSAGGWLTLNQTPVTQYQGAYVTAFAGSSWTVNSRICNPKYSCFYWEDATPAAGPPPVVRLVEETRSDHTFSEILYPTVSPTISPVVVLTLKVDDDGISLGEGTAQQFLQQYDVVSGRWLGNMFSATIAGDIVTKAAAALSFTPGYTHPDEKNIASVGFATNSGASPFVVWTSF